MRIARGLWEISRPAAERVRERLIAVERLSSLPNPWAPPEPEPDFDDGFPEWWEDQDPIVERDIALIPSTEFRQHLTNVREGIGEAWALRQVGYAADQRESVSNITQIGIEVVSAWLRGERSLSVKVHEDLLELTTRRGDVNVFFEEQEEARKANAATKDRDSRP